MQHLQKTPGEGPLLTGLRSVPRCLCGNPFICLGSRNTGHGTRVTSHESPVTPSVPLRPNALGATIGKGTRFLYLPGKQLRSPRCLRLGERTLVIARSWLPLQVVPGSIVLKLDRSRVARATHPCGTES